MLTSILTYLSSNKLIVVGAFATTCECLVIAVNTWRQLRKEKSMAKALSVDAKSFRKVRSMKTVLLWSANPLNLFKSV